MLHLIFLLLRIFAFGVVLSFIMFCAAMLRSFMMIFELGLQGLILLLLGILSSIFAFMCLFAFLNKESLQEHFDRFTHLYLWIFVVTIPLFVFLILYRISPVAFGIGIVGLMFSFRLFALERRYQVYDGRNYTTRRQPTFFNRYFRNREARIKRRVSLKKAAAFVRPYKDLMGKHILSNKYCQIVYNPENELSPLFTCMGKVKDKKGEYPIFEAFIDNDKAWYDDFFDSICFNFSYNTSLEHLYSLFDKSKFTIANSTYDRTPIIESYDLSKKISPKQEEILARINKEEKKKEKHHYEKINVNEATEAELTVLPGINIVQAKKIIKYRDLHGDFASVDEFFSYIKTKPHFEEQLRNRIKAVPLKININLKQCIDEERIVDLD